MTVAALAAPAYSDPVSTTTTDASGGYQLALGSGTYHLRFDKPGYRQSVYGGGSGVDVVVTHDGDVSVDGEPVEDNVLDDVALTSQSLHQVSGLVADAEGVWLAGVLVEVFVPEDVDAPVDTATTDGSGAYGVEVPTGRYLVRYTDPGGGHLTQWYGGAERTELVVTGPLALDGVLLSRAAPTTELVIAGVVVDALGRPVDGVTVWVSGIGGSEDGGSATTGSLHGAAGSYSVSVLPGTYRVTYAKAGWTTTTYGGIATPATVTVAADGTLSFAPDVDVVDNRIPDVTLASTPFSVTGVVATSGGSALSGITVRAFPEGSTDPGDVVDSDTSGAGGSYTLDLPVGAYDLEYVDDDGVDPAYSSTSMTQVRVEQGGSLTVGDAAVALLPETRLAQAAADTPHPVLGSVVDANGAAVDGLTVTAVPQHGGQTDSDATGADGELGDHGRFRLMLEPGTYLVEVDGDEDWLDTTYSGWGSTTALVAVAMNGTVSVNGTPIAGRDLGETEVSGRTQYSVGGTVGNGSVGLAGITVTAYSESEPTIARATATSGPGGSWSLGGARGLTVGRYVLDFSGTVGGVTYDRTYFGGATPTPVVVAQGGTVTVDGSLVDDNVLPTVTMTSLLAGVPHAVLGILADVNGDPIDGATVTAVPQGETPTTHQAAVTTGTGEGPGRYRLSLKPGAYRITYAADGFTGATYPGSGAAALDVIVRLDGVVVVASRPLVSGALDRMTLEDGLGTGSISGRVVAVDETTPGGITVDVFPVADLSDEAQVATTTTSAGGAWSVAALEIGTYTVRLTDGVLDDVVHEQTSVGPIKVGQRDEVSADGVLKPAGAIGDIVMRLSAVQPPVVQPPVVQPPVVQPPVQPPGGGDGGGSTDGGPSKAGAPTIRKARSGTRGGPSSATVRWAAPVAADRGSAVVSYRVQALMLKPSGAGVHRTVRTTGPSARSMVIRLAPGTYTFRVCAVDEAGRSTWSAWSNRVVAR